MPETTAQTVPKAASQAVPKTTLQAVSKMDIVFDHSDFVVVNKPVNMAVHAHDEPTLLDAVRAHFGSEAIHPVHRLDLATSGLVVFAKTSAANRALCQAFAEQRVQKVYLALTTAKAKKKQGWIKGDMQKARGGSYKLLHSQHNPAVTYALSFGSESEPRLWLLRPKSGKTHQLRVALKSWSAPILGDKRYGGAPADRLYLHALAIKFTLGKADYAFEVKPVCGTHFMGVQAQQRLAALGDVWAQAWPKGL